MSDIDDLPALLRDCLVEPGEALSATVTSGTRIGSGLATAEPVSFYARLWDHVREHDLHDLEIRQGLFLAAHPLIVGDRLSRRIRGRVREPGTSGAVERTVGAVSDRAARVVGRVRGTAEDLWDLRLLTGHLEELDRRNIRFVSGFLGPFENTVIPGSLPVRALFPRWAGRTRPRTGVVRYQPAHFPDAGDALVRDPRTGRLRVDLLVLTVPPPDRDGRISLGLANGVNGDVLEFVLDDPDVELLLYVNPDYPWTAGFPGARQIIDSERLRPLAASGRLRVVEDDAPPPALPAGAFDTPGDTEQAIGEQVAGHILDHPELTTGRSLQVGIGGPGVQAIRRLEGSDWRGGGYTEMLEPSLHGLLDAGNITRTHYLDRNGDRRQIDETLVCTFAIAEADDDLYQRLDGDETVRMGSATRVLRPEAFHGGLGINNILGIDFQGNVNLSARDTNPYTGVGGAAVIHRGLATGGVAYLCLRSTHTTAAGRRRSSIFTYLPRGTPVSLTGPDLMGTRGRARFHLVTEFGIAPINAMDQHEFVRNLISVAHPDFRGQLARRAWEEFRIPV